MARLMAEQLGFDFFFPVYQQKDFNKVKNPIPRNSSVLEWIQELPNKDPSLREPAEKVLKCPDTRNFRVLTGQKSFILFACWKSAFA